MCLTWRHLPWHLSKCINCIKRIIATQTVICSSASLERPSKSFLSFHWAAYGPIPCAKPNQRSHSCSVVPSIDKGWALQCGRAFAMFLTDGCMPGAQFDSPVESYGLCLKLGSAVDTRTAGSESCAWAWMCVCACVYACVNQIKIDLSHEPNTSVDLTVKCYLHALNQQCSSSRVKKISKVKNKK